jgi:hypothetical protein
MSNDLTKWLSRSNLAKPFFAKLALVFLAFNLLWFFVDTTAIAIDQMLNERISVFLDFDMLLFHFRLLCVNGYLFDQTVFKYPSRLVELNAKYSIVLKPVHCSMVVCSVAILINVCQVMGVFMNTFPLAAS